MHQTGRQTTYRGTDKASLCVQNIFTAANRSQCKNHIGKRHYIAGSIQVEGAFGVLKEDMGFRQFLLRSQVKVETELLLLCMGYNVKKLHNKIQSGRCGMYLHILKAA